MSLLSEKKITVLQAQEVVAPQLILGVSPQIPQSLNVATASYVYPTVGGAAGTYTLVLSKPIPAGSVVGNLFINATTAPTSGGAPTYSLGLNGATDLVNAQPIVAVAASAAVVNVIAASNTYSLTLTLSAPGLTAGVVDFRLQYA